MTTALGCIFAIAMLIFLIAFIAEWSTLHKQLRKYQKYGIWFGLLVIGLDLLIVILTPSAWGSGIWILIISEPIVFLRLLGFTMVGMYHSARLGIPSLPLLLQWFPPTLSPEDESPVIVRENIITTAVDPVSRQVVPVSENIQLESEPLAIPEQTVQEINDVVPEFSWKAYTLHVGGAALFGILYTTVLFLITRPQLSEIMQRRVDISAMQATDAFSLQGIIILLEVAIAEEIVFRLGIQNFLGRLLKDRSYWIAIALTSAIWTLGHAGVLQPDWVKLAQIFPIGLVLGWLYRKYGVESTIIVHSIFNVVLGLLSIQLIQ